jgi:hypothetical protein
METPAVMEFSLSGTGAPAVVVNVGFFAMLVFYPIVEANSTTQAKMGAPRPAVHYQCANMK